MELELHDLLLAQFSENGDGPMFYNCWNSSREIYKRFGRWLPRYSDYIAAISQRDNLIRTIIDDDFISISKPEIPCIVTFRLSRYEPRAITHMGVVISKRRFFHISKRVGASAIRLDDRRWSKKIEGFYRYAGNN